MKKKLLVCFTLLFAILAGCKSMEHFFQKPTVSFDKMSISGMSLFDADLLFSFSVNNPNPIGGTIRKGQYRLSIEDFIVAEGVLDKGVSLQARGSRSIDLPVHINFMDLFRSASALAAKNEVPYSLTGSFDVMGFDTPFENKGHISLPEFPEISLDSVRISRLDLSGAEMGVILTVANPNRFSINLDGLRYSMDMGGMRFVSGEKDNIPAIDPSGQESIAIPVGVDFINMGRAAMNLLSGNTAPFQLSGDMRFRLPGGRTETLKYSSSGETKILR